MKDKSNSYNYKNKLLILSFSFFLFFILSLSFIHSQEYPLNDGYLNITTCQELQNINLSLSSNYQLLNNIDCSDTINWNSGTGFYPIGKTGQYSSNAFTGNFDGRGFIISDLFINNTNCQELIGLFARTINANIRNIHLRDINYYQAEMCGDFIGGLIGMKQGGNTLNSSVIGNIYNGGESVGGLIGYAGTNSIITNCFTKGNMTSFFNEGAFRGGIIGKSEDEGSVITNSYSNMNIYGCLYLCGGLIGGFIVDIYNSYSSGLIETIPFQEETGGLAGINYETTSNSFYDTETSNQTDNTGKGTPKTTQEMYNIDTFNTWDISLKSDYQNTTWFIDNGTDYPRLFYEFETEPEIPDETILTNVLYLNIDSATNHHSTRLSKVLPLFNYTEVLNESFEYIQNFIVDEDKNKIYAIERKNTNNYIIVLNKDTLQREQEILMTTTEFISGNHIHLDINREMLYFVYFTSNNRFIKMLNTSSYSLNTFSESFMPRSSFISGDDNYLYIARTPASSFQTTRDFVAYNKSNLNDRITLYSSGNSQNIVYSFFYDNNYIYFKGVDVDLRKINKTNFSDVEIFNIRGRFGYLKDNILYHETGNRIAKRDINNLNVLLDISNSYPNFIRDFKVLNDIIYLRLGFVSSDKKLVGLDIENLSNEINFNTDFFSYPSLYAFNELINYTIPISNLTQIQSIPDVYLIENQIYNISLNNYFDNINYYYIEYIDTINNNTLRLDYGFSSLNADFYEVKLYPNDILEVSSYYENYTTNIIVYACDNNNICLSDDFNLFITSSIEMPVTQLKPFKILYNIGTNLTERLFINEFYNYYDTINISFFEPLNNSTINLGCSFGDNEVYYNGSIQINMTCLSFNIIINFTSNKLNFNERFNITASNQATNLSDYFNISSVSGKPIIVQVLNNIPMNYNSIFHIIPSEIFDLETKMQVEFKRVDSNNFIILEKGMPKHSNNYFDIEFLSNGSLIINSKNMDYSFSIKYIASNIAGTTETNHIISITEQGEVINIPDETIVSKNILNQGVNFLMNLFPHKDDISKPARAMYVLIFLAIPYILLFVISSPATIWGIIILNVLTIIFFISLGYIPIIIVITLFLILVTLSYLKFKGGE